MKVRYACRWCAAKVSRFEELGVTSNQTIQVQSGCVGNKYFLCVPVFSCTNRQKLEHQNMLLRVRTEIHANTERRHRNVKPFRPVVYTP